MLSLKHVFHFEMTSTCVIKDIYEISFEKAKALVGSGEAQKEDFWVFVGYSESHYEKYQEILSRHQLEVINFI